MTVWVWCMYLSGHTYIVVRLVWVIPVSAQPYPLFIKWQLCLRNPKRQWMSLAKAKNHEKWPVLAKSKQLWPCSMILNGRACMLSYPEWHININLSDASHRLYTPSGRGRHFNCHIWPAHRIMHISMSDPFKVQH